MEDLETRLRRLSQKWISQARHPMRVNAPQDRELLEKCARELHQELHLGERVIAAPLAAVPDDGTPITTCCGQDMLYDEFATVRRYYCAHRLSHPAVWVDQRNGTWERREQ
jgi:hypothetical protein